MHDQRLLHRIVTAIGTFGLALALCCFAGFPAHASDSIRIAVDGVCVDQTGMAEIYLNDQNRIMIMAGDLAQMLKASSCKVKDGVVEISWSDSQIAGGVMERMEVGSNKLQVGSSTVTMACSPVKKGDFIYIPLSDAVDPTGYELIYDSDIKVIHIFTENQDETTRDKIMAGVKRNQFRISTYDRLDIETVPILTYHEVNSTPAGALFPIMYTDPGMFGKHLDYLQNQGYTTISLEDLYQAWCNDQPLPDKPIVLTFDDGYENMYTTVAPELIKRNMTATFFLVCSTLDTEDHLTSEQAKDLVNMGFEVGSHGYKHQDLRQSDLAVELKDSKSFLENVTGREVKFVAYPYGYYDDNIIQNAWDYGYRLGLSTDVGWTSAFQNPMALKRIQMYGGDTVWALDIRLKNFH